MTKKKRETKVIFRSVEEFEKKYFPELSVKRRIAATEDPKLLGSELATEALEKVKQHLHSS